MSKLYFYNSQGRLPPDPSLANTYDNAVSEKVKQVNKGWSKYHVRTASVAAALREKREVQHRTGDYGPSAEEYAEDQAAAARQLAEELEPCVPRMNTRTLTAGSLMLTHTHACARTNERQLAPSPLSDPRPCVTLRAHGSLWQVWQASHDSPRRPARVSRVR